MIKRIMYSGMVLAMAGGTALTTAGATSASVAPPRPANVTVHVVEKSGAWNQGTRAAQAGSFRILVKIGAYNKWAPSEDFRQVRQLDGSYRLEYAPAGAHTGRYLVAYEREAYQRWAFQVPDARLGTYYQATVFTTGPAGPLGYSQLQTHHHHGARVEALVLTVDQGGKLDLQPARMIPGTGYPSAQLFKLVPQLNPIR